MKLRVDLTGHKYARLFVKCLSGRDKKGNSLWECVCDCKEIRIVRGYSLQNGNTRSCGCLKNELTSKMNSKRLGRNNPNYTHGDCIGDTAARADFVESIRERDNYACLGCYKTQEQELASNGDRLAVHHINGDRTDNRQENAITLCAACHQICTARQMVERRDQMYFDVVMQSDALNHNDLDELSDLLL